jgi:integrase/recombinase XerC
MEYRLRRCSVDTPTAVPHDLVPVSSNQISNPLVPGTTDIEDLLSSFLSNKSPKTIEAYRKDLRYFTKFLNVETIEEATKILLSKGLGPANTLALKYKSSLTEKKLASSTINRRLSALRSLVEMAGTLGIINWELKLKSSKTKPYRDTSGPGVAGFRKLLKEISTRNDKKGVRDKAILRLLFDLGLRRTELISLNMEDLDMEAGRIAVTGKGDNDKTLLSLPEKTLKALSGWISVRGSEPGALFINFDRAKKGNRLSGHSLYRIVRGLGNKVGLKTRPHGLRHSSITEAVRAAQSNGIDITTVLHFSRHKDIRTLMIYMDHEKDMQGTLANLVSNSVA